VRWQGTFLPDPPNVTEARHAAVAALRRAGVGGTVLDTSEIIVGELVANAVRHARTELTAVVDVSGDMVRLEVIDLDSRPPALLAADEDSTSGRGLQIVAALATRWGWEAASTEEGIAGKKVWAEVDARQAG
jgi:anti-sigma regulatory factor (Ser/Thr protein kinase)